MLFCNIATHTLTFSPQSVGADAGLPWRHDVDVLHHERPPSSRSFIETPLLTVSPPSVSSVPLD